MQSRIVRAIFITTLLLAIGAIIVPFLLFGFSKVEVWNTVAASLAVITALISAWTTQTLFERQEEAQRPNPYLELDNHNRPGLYLLRLTNMGASTAYDIRLNWNRPLLNAEGKQVLFSQGDPEVLLLNPNKSIAVFIDGSSDFLKKYKDAEFSGIVEFKDNPLSNKIFRHDFYISAEMYRYNLRYAKEEQVTQAKIQELPDVIKGITTELKGLRSDFKEVFKLGEDGDETLTDTGGKLE
jgi:hypothetical protein